MKKQNVLEIKLNSFRTFIYNYIEYYCIICHKTISIKSKRKKLQSLTHIEFGKSVRKKEIFKNLDFFEIGEIFNKYITNQKEKFENIS